MALKMALSPPARRIPRNVKLHGKILARLSCCESSSLNGSKATKKPRLCCAKRYRGACRVLGENDQLHAQNAVALRECALQGPRRHARRSPRSRGDARIRRTECGQVFESRIPRRRGSRVRWKTRAQAQRAALTHYVLRGMPWQQDWITNRRRRRRRATGAGVRCVTVDSSSFKRRAAARASRRRIVSVYVSG